MPSDPAVGQGLIFTEDELRSLISEIAQTAFVTGYDSNSTQITLKSIVIRRIFLNRRFSLFTELVKDIPSIKAFIF